MLGGRAGHRRCRGGRPRGALAHVGAAGLDRPRRPRRLAARRRGGAHRAGGRQARRGLRHGRRGRRRRRRPAGDARRRRTSSRCTSRSRTSTRGAHRRRAARGDEADGDPREHGARPGRRPRRARRRALHDGEIGGAALDVTVPEPLPADDPLLQAPNVLVVPHIGSATEGARPAMTDLAVEQPARRPRRRAPPLPRPADAVRVASSTSGRTRRACSSPTCDGRATLTELERRSTVTRLGPGRRADGTPARRGRSRAGLRRRSTATASSSTPTTPATHTVAVLTAPSATPTTARTSPPRARALRARHAHDHRRGGGPLTFRGATSRRAADGDGARRRRHRRRLDRARRPATGRDVRLPRLDAGRRRAPWRAPPDHGSARPGRARVARRRTCARRSTTALPDDVARERAARRRASRARRRPPPRSSSSSTPTTRRACTATSSSWRRSRSSSAVPRGDD